MRRIERRNETTTRFLSFIQVNEMSNCCVWLGERNSKGYGKFWYRKNWLAHRFAYQWWKGPIIEGKQIDHTCRNPSCVNLLHLQLVTPKENAYYSSAPPVINAQKLYCIRGHPLMAHNLRWVIEKSGKRHRQCRSCLAMKSREYRRQRKAIIEESRRMGQ